MNAVIKGLAWISDEEIRRHGAYISDVWGRKLCIPCPCDGEITEDTPRAKLDVFINGTHATVGGWIDQRQFQHMHVNPITWHDMVACWSDSVNRILEWVYRVLCERHTGSTKAYVIHFEFAAAIYKWIPMENLSAADQARVCRVMGYPPAGKNGAV